MKSQFKNNSLCYCGSGKKYKNCCKGKKSRQLGIHLNFNMGTIDIATLEKLPTGEYIYKGTEKKPDSIKKSFTISYERDKKPKTILEYPFEQNISVLNQGDFFSAFDYIFAVDTNTRFINNFQVSVSVATACQIRKQEDRSYLADYLFMFQYAFYNKKYPEKTGWMKAIQSISSMDCYSIDMKVLLVTDYDQANLMKYNTRDLPLLEGYYLPKGFTMLYATDAVADFLPNKLISYCDREANKIMAKLLKSTETSEMVFEKINLFVQPL